MKDNFHSPFNLNIFKKIRNFTDVESRAKCICGRESALRPLCTTPNIEQSTLALLLSSQQTDLQKRCQKGKNKQTDRTMY